MPGSSEPSNILTFVMLEVIFHPRPPILPAKVGCFHPHGTLLAQQCAITGLEFLKARQLLLHKLKHKEWTVLASYMMSSMPKELPLTFHANPTCFWKPPSLTGYTMSC